MILLYNYINCYIHICLSLYIYLLTSITLIDYLLPNLENQFQSMLYNIALLRNSAYYFFRSVFFYSWLTAFLYCGLQPSVIVAHIFRLSWLAAFIYCGSQPFSLAHSRIHSYLYINEYFVILFQGY